VCENVKTRPLTALHTRFLERHKDIFCCMLYWFCSGPDMGGGTNKLGFPKLFNDAASSRWGKPRPEMVVFLLALICVVALPTPGYTAGASDILSGSSAVSALNQSYTPVIVIGFLGGFVPHDEPHHPEVQLIEDLRHGNPDHVYFGLFENRKVGEAYKTILRLLGAQKDRTLPNDEKRQARIILFGHSWGASAVVGLSRKLEQAGLPVTLTIQIDSVAKPFQNDWLIPPNVSQALNVYQTHGFIHGRRRIVPADPKRTAILGNFLWEYKGEPEVCHGFSWRGRLLSKGHTQIECDPHVWSQVRALILSRLPNTAVTQSDGSEFRLPLSTVAEAP